MLIRSKSLEIQPILVGHFEEIRTVVSTVFKNNDPIVMGGGGANLKLKPKSLGL